MTAHVFSTIAGLQDAQRRNLERFAALRPENLPGRISQLVAANLHRYATLITHVDTGAWRASHRIFAELQQGRATIHIDPAARNPRSGIPVISYAGYWEQLGGEMAVYSRTVREQGRYAVQQAIALARRELLG